MKRILAAALCLLLTACARVSLPEKGLAGRLGYGDKVAALYRLDSQWWKVYNDGQLDRLVDLALRNNVDLAKAAVNVNRALYQANLIGADLVPTFSGSGSGSASRRVDRGDSPKTDIGAEAKVSYEVDLWQKVAASASAAQWEYQATLEDREAARLALVGSVVDVYYQLAYTNDSLKAAGENIANYRALLGQVEAKHAAGKVAAVEVAQANQALLAAENTRVGLLTQRQNAQATLRNLLNAGPDAVLPEPTLQGFSLPGVDLNVPLSVLVNRPDLRAAEMRLQKAFKDVQASERAWLPSLSISGAISSSAAKFGEALNSPAASGGLTLALPFLDWERLRWNLRLSEADFETARLGFEQALTTALNEVDTYYANYGRLRETLANTERKHGYDLKVRDYYRARYNAGAGELADWLDAQNAANSSYLSLLESRYQAVGGENAIYKALAGRYR